MPKFEKNQIDHTNDINEILIDIPFEKTYLSDPNNPKLRANQKQGTCWYYVLDCLRVPYGKGFPSNHPGRKAEAVISAYRKATTALDENTEKLISILQSLHFEYGEDTKLDKKIIKNRLDFAEENTPFLSNNITIYKTFLNQTSNEFFDDFLEEVISKATIEICKTTLVQLETDPDVALKKYLNDYPDSDLDLATIYQFLVYQKSAEQYHLQASSWHPQSGIEVLIEELRKNGALASSGAFGHNSFFNDPELVSSNFSKRPLYGRDNEDLPEGTLEGHEILIIGAKKEGKKEEVYFLDPNDFSKVNVISYKEFTSRICNTYGIANTNNGPFAFHADQKWMKQEKKAYSSLFKNDHEIKEIEEKMGEMELKGKKLK